MHTYSLRASRAETAIYIVGFSILMGLLARVSIPLPFTPVPITGQTFGMMLAGAVLSSPAAAAAMLLYLMQGAAGLPVFAPGPGGVAQLTGPTGGFLLALPVAAFVVAALKPWTRLPLALVAGEVTLFAFGAAWLAALSTAPVDSVLRAAVFPFVPGEILKAALVVAVAAGFRARAHRA